MPRFENKNSGLDNVTIQFEIEIISRKVKITMDRSYTINLVTPHGVVELIDKGGYLVLVNGQRLKHYFKGTTKVIVDEKLLQCNALWNVENSVTVEEDSSEENEKIKSCATSLELIESCT